MYEREREGGVNTIGCSSFPFSLHCSLFPAIVILTKTKHWSINVPSSIKGLNGSCVVIPCSFDFPDSKNDLKFTGMWKDGSDQLIYHSVKSKIMHTYWNRTELLGNLAQKNCSLKIDPLNDSDGGPFHFRVEIDKLDKFSYKDNKVSILMISKSSNTMLIFGPEDDRSTLAVCFVTHSCPTSPPVFTWSHAGSQKVQHTLLKDGQWNAKSTLRFQATKEDNNKHLRCRVTYKGGQQQEAASLLEVICKYASARISNLYILIAIGGGTLLLILQILLTCVQKWWDII
uniref:Ig-like domain-containing protein n=1 Tax=Takifugu rubripes TaxID=31033 RepID=A0A674ML39_TAKRU